MPGFAHICFALGISLFLNKITKGRFTQKHAIIFTVNNFVGPDLMGAFFDYESSAYLFTHGYGWFLPAIPLTFVWMLFTHLQLQWKPFNISKRDMNKEFVIQPEETYCLIAAGGIFHQFVDILGHPSYINYNGVPDTPWGGVWFGGDNFVSVEWIWGTGMFPCGNELGFTEMYIFLGLILPVALLFMFFFMQKNTKTFYRVSIITIVMYFIPLLIAYLIPDMTGFDVYAEGVNYFGDRTQDYVPFVYRLTGGEADFGVLVYYLLFFFLPLLLTYWGYRGVPKFRKKGIRAKIEEIENETDSLYKQKVQELIDSRS